MCTAAPPGRSPRILAGAAAALMILMLSLPPPAGEAAGAVAVEAAAPPPGDVDGHWSEAAVRAMVALEVISGFPDGTFRPEEAVTREQFLKMMVTCLGWEVPRNGSATAPPRWFTDVPPGRWSSPYLAAAVERGVLEVPPDGLFSPERPATRLEVAEWLARADPGLPRLEPVPDFTDWEQVPEASRPAVRAVAAAGLVRGYPDGRFAPGGTLRRSEAATLLWRYLCLPRPRELGGIYAIRSYEQRSLLPRLDWAAFGWAVLEAGEAGPGGASRPRVRTDSPSSPYRLPEGWEEVAGLSHGLLMVFCDRPEVVRALLDNPAWWPQVADEAVAAARRLGFGGLLLDFEHLRDRDATGSPGLAVRYADFLALLRARLDAALPGGSGVKLVVAVHAPNVPGHYDGYDFAGIARAADRLLLMAHDYHDSRVPSPPAPLPAVAQAVRTLLDAGVEPGRIVLGLSLTAQQWVLDGGGRVLRTYSPLLDTVYRAVEERTGAGGAAAEGDGAGSDGAWDAVDRLDPVAHMRVLRYAAEREGVREENVIWYEDAASLRAKLAVVRRYRLAGASLWRLGIVPEGLFGAVFAPCRP